MTKPSTTLIVLISISIATLLFFSSNIYGYFRFKSYCSSEGGLRVYEKLERDVGWLAKDKYEAHTVALLNGIGFVRYTDKKDGQIYDIKYIGGDPQSDSSFKISLANEQKTIMYMWRYNYIHDFKKGLGRMSYEVLKVPHDKVLVSFTSFGFGFFDDSKTPLSTNVKDSCFTEYYQSLAQHPKSRFLIEMSSAFKN